MRQTKARTTNRRRALALAIVIVAGMSCRGIRGMPQFVSKDVADVLWAAAIYLLLRLCLPRRSIWIVALVATVVAFGIEFLKLDHGPWLEALRDTRVGLILLGRYFHWADLLRCAVGIGLAMVLDGTVVSRVSEPRT